MDANTLRELGAIPLEFEQEFESSASVELKDGYWRSAGGKLRMRFHIAEGADPDAVLKAAHEYVKAAFTETRGAEIKELLALKAKTPQEAPRAAPSPALVEAAVDPGAGIPEAEFRVFEVTHFKVHEVDGKRSAKVYGPPFTKFGVTAWPEVMATAGIDLKIVSPGAEHKFPEGITKARAMLNEKGNPQKVIKFE